MLLQEQTRSNQSISVFTVATGSAVAKSPYKRFAPVDEKVQGFI